MKIENLPVFSIQITVTAMSERTKIDSSTKLKIVKLRQENLTMQQIADKVKCSKSVICKILKRYNDTGSSNNKKKPGRPRKTTVRQDRMMHRLALKGRFNTVTGISKQVKDVIGVSRQTMSRRLPEIGLFARCQRKKPLISKKKPRARLGFANRHVLWSKCDWNRVFFSDESKFNIFGSDGKQYVRRRKGEELKRNCVKKTVKIWWRQRADIWNDVCIGNFASCTLEDKG